MYVMKHINTDHHARLSESVLCNQHARQNNKDQHGVEFVPQVRSHQPTAAIA